MNSPQPVTADIEAIIKGAKSLERLVVAESDVLAPQLKVTIMTMRDLLDRVLHQYTLNIQNPSPRLSLPYGTRQHDFIRTLDVGVRALPEISAGVARVCGDRYARVFIDLTSTIVRAKEVITWLADQE